MVKYINNSALSLFSTCETKAWIRWGQEKVMAQAEAPGPMQVGSVLHAQFKHWMEGGTYDDATFDAAWQEHMGDILPNKERLYKENVQKVLLAWHAKQELASRRLTMLQPEHELVVPLGQVRGEEIVFYGTADGIIEWNDYPYLLEHKTTGMMTAAWCASWEMKSQLQGYMWALRELGHTVRGAFINALEVRKLPPWDGNMQKKCGTHKLKYAECQPAHVKTEWIGPLTWSDARLDTWRENALSIADRLLDMKRPFVEALPLMDGQFKWPGCEMCSYRRWCQAGRPLENLDSMMIHESWKMLDGLGEEEEGLE